MAVLKQRLSQRQPDGSFSPVHFETSSEIVMRPDGTSMETTVSKITSDLSTIQEKITPAGIGAAPAERTHGTSDITDFPTSLPASDVSAWAKEATKPSYTAAEVGASPTGHKHTKSDITDFPESMPASDVYAWAKADSKPTYTASEVGALASGGTAAAATKLATQRTFRVNLASTSAVNFDGTANVTPGVSGTLPVANGGTGVTTTAALKDALGVTAWESYVLEDIT